MPAGMIDVHPEKRHHHDQGQFGGEIALSKDQDDAERLAALGYKQELNRSWGLLENFGSSFSIISVVTGTTTLLGSALNTGGPAVISFGWIFVSFFTMFVAVSMAEIVSACPTAGGPYHWSALCAPPKYSAFAAWTTGYFNLLGQVAVTTGISFGLAGLISTLAAYHGYEPTAPRTIGIFAALLVSHGLVNTFGVRGLAWFNRLSVALQSIGVGAMAIALLASAPKLQSGRDVFLKFYDGTGLDGVGWSERASPAYVACIGILIAQYTITGFDCSAHMSEETHSAARTAPIGVILSVGVSCFWGFFLLMAYLFSIQDFDATIASSVGSPVLTIFIACFGDPGASVAFAFIIVCVWHCGLFSITANSRMMYAFSRERALPGFFDHVDEKYQSPIRAVWLAVVLGFCLALPSLGSTVAFSAATSIATIGLYISYTVPIAIRFLAWRRFDTIKGPFNLGVFGRPVAFVATAYVGFITIVFCMPTVNPIDSQTLNYTPVAVGIVLLWVFASWFLFARKWYKGPRLLALAELQLEPGRPVLGQLEDGDDKEEKKIDASVQRVLTI